MMSDRLSVHLLETACSRVSFFHQEAFFERCIVYTSKVRLLATSQQSQKPFLKAHSSVVAFAPQAITK